MELENRYRKPQEQITSAAYRVLAEKGYDGATIKEIARIAGVAPGLKIVLTVFGWLFN